MKTVLLSGATGFLGSSIVKALLGKYNLIILKRSASSTARLSGLLDKLSVYTIETTPPEIVFSENNIDVVIHTATDYGRKHRSPVGIVQANLLLPLNLIETAANNNVGFFINTDTVLSPDTSSYALSKSQFVAWLKLYAGRMRAINVKLEHFYGPDNDDSKFITYLIKQLLQKAPAIDLTAGRQIRDFIYIDDVVNAYVCILNHIDGIDNYFSEFEIGTGHARSLRDVVEIIRSLSGNRETLLNFGKMPYRKNEKMHFSSNLNAITALGWKPETSLREGIEKTLVYCRKIYADEQH